MKHKISKFLINSFIVYVLLNITVVLLDKKYEYQLKSFDKNNDGFFQSSEINEDQKAAMKKVTNDTARNLAPFTLIPFSLLIGSLTILKIKK
ncbi:hypothetical protein [Tenacibaculum sp. IB213877]|uniref:hypothetical protein n=1 Tax=Tenacibaculum sp. IB213877 TaxID=3097351 RepID=UPI002A5A237B|nr:hypothetical protein [Tenacibaculum sp. IB213877]MDY0779194.1 hypothetical protein [Tenacibaculum sp. IB213877]